MSPASQTATSDDAVPEDDQLPDVVDDLPFELSETPLRREVDGGEEHLVVPTTAQLEGVYAYPNSGPGPPSVDREYLPGEELTANLQQWNGQPLVLRHPRQGNELVTTDAPGAEVVEVGEFRNVEDHSTDEALRGEAWIRANELGRHDGDLWTYVREVAGGRYGEVSTGYIPRIENESGTFDGKRYNAVQRDLQPDHLALLPDSVGNCSVEDGCGIGRFNSHAQACGIRANVRTARPPDHDESHVTMSDSTTDESTAGAADGPETTPDPDSDREQVPDRPLAQVRANARDTVRTPSYTDTKESSGDWERPPLDAYVEAAWNRRRDSEPDDLPSDVSDLSADIKQWISARSLLGDSEAESYDELVMFPVVTPNNTLSEDALDAVLSTAGSADISEDLTGRVMSKARDLLEDEFDREFDDRENTRDQQVRSNIRAEARTPEYSGTVSRLEEEVDDEPLRAIWDLGDYFEVWAEDQDGQPVSDPYSPLVSIPDEAREWIAQHSLLGSAEAETEQNLLMFAVVSPEGELYETRLEDVLGPAGARATIPPDQRRSARSVARDLLESEFGWSFEETEGEARANEGDTSELTAEDMPIDPEQVADDRSPLQVAYDMLGALVNGGGSQRANAAPDADAGEAEGQTEAEAEEQSQSRAAAEEQDAQTETAPAESGEGDAEADAEDAGDTESDAEASDAANAPTPDDDSSTPTMADRTQELVEEHGFDAENLPDESEDCFDRIYDKFADSADADAAAEAQAGEQTDAESTDVDGSVDADTQTTPEADGQAQAQADAEEEAVTANRDERINELEQRIEELQEEALGPDESEVQEVNRKLRDNADWTDEEIESTPFGARKKAAAALDDGDETRASEQAIGGQESQRSNFAGRPRESRANARDTDDVDAPTAGYYQRLNSQGGDN